ncbi:MAG: archease [Nitrospirales bacterium]|nr:archease [Nitrospirales bacterium]
MVLLPMDFELIDISGDAGIAASGRSWAEAFSRTAMGMYSLITSPEGIEKQQEKIFELESESLGTLLVNFLNELVFLFDTYGFIGRRVEVTGLSLSSPFKLRATVHGEVFDASRHERRLLIKAATYHKLLLKESNGTWKAEVIFDI